MSRHQTPIGTYRIGTKRRTHARFNQSWRGIMCCNEMHHASLPAIDISKVRVADSHGTLQHRVKNRLQSPWKARNDLQHFRSRCLALKRISEVSRALLQFVEQPRVLDGDDGLGGEVLHQLNLFVSEGSNLLAVDTNGTHELVVLEHWYSHKRPCVPKLCNRRVGLFHHH